MHKMITSPACEIKIHNDQNYVKLNIHVTAEDTEDRERAVEGVGMFALSCHEMDVISSTTALVNTTPPCEPPVRV